MPDHNFQPGDLLVCKSKYYSDQLNIGGMPGIVMGTKPHHIHLWFEPLKRGFWLTHDLLKKADVTDVSPLIKRVQILIYQLNAEEWELEEDAELYKLICYVDEVPFETLQEIRNYLDIDYKALTMAPEGMGRVLCTVSWLK